MYKFTIRFTLLWSFIFGALLAFLVFHGKKKAQTVKRASFEDHYERWFEENHLRRTPMLMDRVRYGKYNLESLESNYLYNRVSLICVLLVRRRKNSIAANNTWAKHCNERTFIYLKPKRVQKTMLPIRREKIDSSWHLLCEAIRKIPPKFQWVLFVYDDTFGIPENIRRMVASLDSDKGHYLGHAISFWGTTYNVGQAGYVLSQGSVRALKKQFNSTEACIAGGRFWKQEDFYLGKVSRWVNF